MRIRSFISNAGSAAKNLIKDWDIFSQKIMFTYNGKQSFATLLGGLYHWWFLLQYWFTEEFYWKLWLIESSTNKARSTQAVDLSTNNFELYPNNYNLQFGILILNLFGQPVSYDPTYFIIKMVEVSTFQMDHKLVEILPIWEYKIEH